MGFNKFFYLLGLLQLKLDILLQVFRENSQNGCQTLVQWLWFVMSLQVSSVGCLHTSCLVLENWLT
jgi:hypothetical protein